jgi:hypothetical protein
MADPKTEKPLTPEKAKIHQIRKDRSTRPGAPKWKAPDGTEHTYHPDMPETTVAVMVNNGAHNGFYAIGRHFPNGLTADVPVTEHELEELKLEPPEIIRVVDASEVASIAGKGSSGSLSHHEQKVLAHFRSSGLDSDAYLAQHQKTGTGSSSSSSSSAPSSSEAGEHHKGKQK